MREREGGHDGRREMRKLIMLRSSFGFNQWWENCLPRDTVGRVSF